MSGLFEILTARLTERCDTLSTVTPGRVAAEVENMAVGPDPIVLIVPAAERWSPVDQAGMKVTASGRFGFSCVLAMTEPSGVDVWEASRRQIRAALLGWTPDEWSETAGPIEASGARLLAYSAEAGGRWIHAFDFNLPVQASYEHQA